MRREEKGNGRLALGRFLGFLLDGLGQFDGLFFSLLHGFGGLAFLQGLPGGCAPDRLLGLDLGLGVRLDAHPDARDLGRVQRGHGIPDLDAQALAGLEDDRGVDAEILGQLVDAYR